MTTYLRYEFQNIEPLRIADDSTSQSGQTISLRYVPGSSIRGLIVNALADNSKFKDIKQILFSNQVRYSNAYPMENGEELIPSPKGFYENKEIAYGKKEIENVVISGEFTEGNKRADIGRFCCFENDCITYYNISSGSDMKIRINHTEKQDVFRNEFIEAGNTFVGYIAIDNEIVKDMIKNVFNKGIILGSARSQGYGKCKVISCAFQTEMPYSRYAVDTDQSGKLFMLLLSNTTMRDEFGQYTGINLTELQNKLSVSDLQIDTCSTSTVQVKGYNRHWGNKIPSVPMYEQGSVFKLGYTGIASIENITQIMNDGIGVRCNEGFGRVIFLKNYELIKYKQEGEKPNKQIDSTLHYSADEATLKLIARNYYRILLREKAQEHILEGVERQYLPKSQIGTVLSLLEKNRYDGERASQSVKAHFEHALKKQEEKKIQKNEASIESFLKRVIQILDSPFVETIGLSEKKQVMGISVEKLISKEELERSKIEYLIELIKYDSRKEENK